MPHIQAMGLVRGLSFSLLEMDVDITLSGSTFLFFILSKHDHGEEGEQSTMFVVEIVILENNLNLIS